MPTLFAADFCGNIVIYQADISVMLSGVGYTTGFDSPLKKFPNMNKLKIHLLILEDIFAETLAFISAVQDLPPLRDLSDGSWASLK